MLITCGLCEVNLLLLVGVSLLVVDGQNVLVGIITQDDVIDVKDQEHIEDIEKFMTIFFSTAKWLLGI